MATLAAGSPSGGTIKRRAGPRSSALPLRLNAVNQRRLANFKANKRAYWSLVHLRRFVHRDAVCRADRQ